jgi:hypothetical protein
MAGVDVLPWSSDRYFRIWNYTLSHSQLSLRHEFPGSGAPLMILFSGVERIELDRGFLGGITIAPLTSHGKFSPRWWRPFLLLELTGRTSGSGFVACSIAQLVQLTVDENRKVVDREVLSGVSAAYSEYGVGGGLAEAGETFQGVQMIRRPVPRPEQNPT